MITLSQVLTYAAVAIAVGQVLVELHLRGVIEIEWRGGRES